MNPLNRPNDSAANTPNLSVPTTAMDKGGSNVPPGGRSMSGMSPTGDQMVKCEEGGRGGTYSKVVHKMTKEVTS